MRHFNFSLGILVFGAIISCASYAHAAPTNLLPSSSNGTQSTAITSSPTVTTGDKNPSSVTSGDSSSGNQASGQTLANPLKVGSLDELLTAVLKAAIQLGTVILTLALVYVGFRFVAARGNEEKIRSARTALMYTIIGGLILLGATAIQAVITSTVSSLTV